MSLFKRRAKPPRRPDDELLYALRDAENRLTGWTTTGTAGIDMHELLRRVESEIVLLRIELDVVASQETQT